MVGRCQARAFSDSTIHIGNGTAHSTHGVMVVVADARLIARDMSGWLDAPDECDVGECGEDVVDGLT